MRWQFEFLEAVAFCAVSIGLTNGAFRCEFGFLEIAEDGFGAVDNRFGYAGQARDLDAVAFVGAAGEDFAEKDDLIVPFADGDVEIVEARESGGEFGEFVVMSGEERFGTDLVMEIFDD